MSDYDIGTYGGRWAPHYDAVFSETAFEVEILEELAGDPPRALELGAGSGRVAIPMAEAGVAVTGIEISDEMLALLTAKPGGDSVNIIKGDFADVSVDERFPLIYLPLNTLFTLLTQERQVECFVNVAEVLEDGGRFVLDAFVPDMEGWDEEHTKIRVPSISSNESHAYELSIHNPVDQTIVSHEVRRLDDGNTVVLPTQVRYAWPSEMDLMARVAGLSLEARWGWYDKRPFTEKSVEHVSVYRRPTR